MQYQQSSASAVKNGKRYRGMKKAAGALVTLGVLGGWLASPGEAKTLSTPSRSSTIALIGNHLLGVVNRETNSVSFILVRNARGRDAAQKLAEVAVGDEPRCIAMDPNEAFAYVTNSLSGTVSVISLRGGSRFTVVKEIRVGTEPRGCAVSPNGTRLFVANHTAGTVSIIDTATLQVVDTAEVGSFPWGIAVTNDGDRRDNDERVFVSRFFADLIPGGPGEGFDTGKQGIIWSFPVNNPNNVDRITLAPFRDVGFTADRSQFCPQSFVPPVAGQTLHSDLFCPDVNADPNSDTIKKAAQGAYPNQIQSLLIRHGLLYVPSIGASPSPPTGASVNIQALVNVVDVATQAERKGLRVNLNEQIATEPPSTAGLDRVFCADLVAVDADEQKNVLLFACRGDNYILRARLRNGKLDIGAPGNVIRFQTGNLPNGIVISEDGRRAYANNEVGVSVTAINLQNNTVIERDIPSGTPPEPGSFEHAVLVGKLAFFTALGIPNNGILDTPIRAFNPVNDRGKQSLDGWSSCASCHPDGLADGATWMFGNGPRQTIALDGSFAKDNSLDQRIFNYSGIRSSNTDFNNNSRVTQGGIGFADDPTDVFNHGRSQGVSDALDVQSLWVQTVRAVILPKNGNAASRNRGREVFAQNCASCHGGAKWSKSQVIYADNPAFLANGGPPRDPGVDDGAGGQILAYNDLVGNNQNGQIKFADDVKTFNANNPLELRGEGALGTIALGAAGFNSPSLLGICYHVPFLHNGQAQRIQDVFRLHALVGTDTIRDVLDNQQEQDLFNFLCSIDGRTDPLRSETDDFLDAFVD